MFKNPFSFYGRIRRLEYGLSIIIMYLYVFACIFIVVFLHSLFATTEFRSGYMMFMMLPLSIPLYWFLFAQGAKRCHDRGNSGWYQIIPFYNLVMLFGDGDYGINEYGPNPKGLGETVEDIIASIGTRVDN
ncbi:DUF805 domain-containing protein [Dysgonomonas massiliensis]|uniref:DUF805 domain-containing protein n=1 Tax=Dysgonomonas massiliensis TaxID=2040292 RepID=UPI000C78BE1C|nr:DUF805 domain-containing protein [Dysgonomonas massiliensis]